MQGLAYACFFLNVIFLYSAVCHASLKHWCQKHFDKGCTCACLPLAFLAGCILGTKTLLD